MSGKTVHYTRKTIEVAPGIKVICGGSVTEADSGHEYGSDSLCLVTRRGTEILDSSPYFIDLQSATLEGNEIVIKWKRQEKYHEERRGVYDESYRWIEEVIRSRECEKRIPVR